MNDPVEIIINMSSHIVAKTKAILPKFTLWHVVNTTSSLRASLELYVADQRPPAFASVEVHCEMPPESYHKRVLSLHTCSDQWDEDDCPGIAEAENEVEAMLQEESRREDHTPAFAFTRLYLNAGARRELLQIKFPEIVCEFDAALGQEPDYDSLSEDTVGDIEAIHRVLLWTKKLNGGGQNE